MRCNSLIVALMVKLLEVIVSITVHQDICSAIRPKFSSHFIFFLLLSMFVAVLSSQLHDRPIVYVYVCSLPMH